MSTSSPLVRSTFDPRDLLTSTALAAFASDESGCITLWNRAAETLLGHDASCVLGKRCYKIISGRDLFGNRFCSDCCALRRMRRYGEPINPFEFDIMHVSGQRIRARCSVIVAPGPRSPNYIHLLEPLVQASESGAHETARRGTSPMDHPSTPNGDNVALTVRELEVLRLISVGTSTQDIARTLCIQITTASNHIQQILKKLGAHNKLQAVYLAQRRGML